MKITHNVALNFHPIFIALNQLFEAILDFGLWICCIALLNHFLLNRQNTLNPNSKIQNL